MPFEGIRIVGVNEQASSRSSLGGAMYEIALELAPAPPWEWSDYFNKFWEQKFYMMKRRAHASGSQIVVTCPIEEVERVHMPFLREVVDAANDAYREHLARIQADDDTMKRRDDEDRERFRDLDERIGD